MHLHYKELALKMPHVKVIAVGTNISYIEEHKRIANKVVNVTLPPKHSLPDLADSFIILELGRLLTIDTQIHGIGLASLDKKLIANFQKICEANEKHFLNFTKYIKRNLSDRRPSAVRKFMKYCIADANNAGLRIGDTRTVVSCMIKALNHKDGTTFTKASNLKVEIAKRIIETFKDKEKLISAFLAHLKMTSAQAFEFEMQLFKNGIVNYDLSNRKKFKETERLPIPKSKVNFYLKTVGLMIGEIEEKLNPHKGKLI